ncbi:putative arsenite-resistance protein [Operophtera brumata]|uniref:Serrate RNA effector molecule homolog n=1 Tax=Operophtera brumata TaxID=104452 RepID=A0A0L7LF96_OPEBR|nr:putative arsenite-resistance protein [Operophtera brumata]
MEQHEQNRLNVFLELLQGGDLDKVTVDVDKSEKLIRLLDTVVIKLEGGTDEDLKELDVPTPADNTEKVEKIDPDKPIVIEDDTVKVKEEKDDSEKKEEKEPEKPEEPPKPTAPLTMEIDPHLRQLQEQAKMFSRSSSSSSSSSSSEDEGGASTRRKSKSKSKTPDKALKIPKEEAPDAEKTETAEKDKTEHSEKNGVEKEVAGEVVSAVVEKKEPRALHKTTSIFLRNLAPSITKAEVEARYGGFLRVALADPLSDRRWFRRGWVTFRREVNIKDICWNLNNIRVQDFSLDSKNPVLHKITEHLIEEASTEEEELLGLEATADTAASEQPEPELMRVLDRLVLYLRVVHSVDYYNHCEYPYEDEMPNQVEKFILSNTQELGKDKWLCPLSGKKFKGPDFIRKHIFNKHAEKVDEVRREVSYFNAYVRDTRRPQQPEPAGRSAPAPSHQPQPAAYGGGPGGGGPPAQRGWGWGGWAPPQPGGAEFRPVIHYRDLDAPREPDEFI